MRVISLKWFFYALLGLGLVFSLLNQYQAAGGLLVLGVLGLILNARVTGGKPKSFQMCPKCLKPVRTGLTVCPHCQSDI